MNLIIMVVININLLLLFLKENVIYEFDYYGSY